MKEKWLLKALREVAGDHNPYAYSSLVEEALKIAFSASQRDGVTVVVKENMYMASHLAELLMPLFEEGEVIAYLPEESLRAEAIAASYENRAERLYALYQLLTGHPKIVVVSPYGPIRHLPRRKTLQQFILPLKTGKILERDDLIDWLNRAGYERVSHIEQALSYAVRGSIVDVFSVNYSRPLRIEFFDNEIDSLRFFDINTQSTVERVDEATLCFAKDVFFSEEDREKITEAIRNPAGAIEMDLEFIREDVYSPKLYAYLSYIENDHLLDYLPESRLYLSDTGRIEEHRKFLTDETVAYIQEMNEENELPLKFYQFADFDRECRKAHIVYGKPFSEAVPMATEVDLPYAPLKELLKILSREENSSIVLALEANELALVSETLIEQEIPYTMLEDRLREGVQLMLSSLPQGFSIPELGIRVFTSAELFDKKPRKGRFALQYAEALTLNSYDELTAGDYVVHRQYGIGQYLGIEQREVNNIRLDYLKIVYAGNDVLLVPLSQFSLVRKFVSKEGVVPKLHKLGSKQWANTKERVKEDIDRLAARLIELYSIREKKTGFAFSKDTPLQHEFERAFTYDLTPDQFRAIAEVKADMESPKPMDRLLCGDVGFGKTEVALRAAFKAALDHKQVAYLCPTTVLSLQHYRTFTDRLKEFPVEVALLNRYTTPSDQKSILQRLKEGKIDIVIGTHRLLSADVGFNDLGLLIIDEEQRFGVEHKEKIKEMKNTIDVLSLSATPIPRTLQMSLVGIYGLSTLDTPPQNRYPIQTYVVEKNEDLVKEVIMRELNRGGQVFYLYNDIARIYQVAHRLEQNIPYAKVAVAHGQMNREEIEDVMLSFYQGQNNILICTTIIETGIDIPNANTILVEHAENFGLSQLYQIKGRVGRGDKIAYAYLLVPPRRQLSEKSEKRLNAIKEFTALGSGYKIAMRDLAIRGAGDLLGSKQSGFIDNVGLDLYLSMLQESINEKTGKEPVKQEEEVKPQIPISSYIPEHFSENDYDKLSIYHRLDEIDGHEELMSYEQQLNDEYGKLPQEIVALFDKKRIELLMKNHEIESTKVYQKTFVLTLSKEASGRIDGYKLFEYCNNLSKDIKIGYTQDRLSLMTANRKEDVYKLIRLSENLKELEKDADR
ncbi:MAG: transcription-repair coupling factor [Erysipelotrichaceae bacterium]|nr:transcription-repair coupling factor [Erysipelotrichaceae bacterium]